MQIHVYQTPELAAEAAATLIASEILAKPNAVIGLPTGSSPVETYRRLARMNRDGVVDFSKVTTFNLDEYVGLKGDHPQSYRRFMNENLFDHVNIPKENTHVPCGTGDVEANLREFNEVLANSQIDIQLLGVGGDGHIGFNEPGDSLYDHAHQEVLDESTIDANARFFASRDDVPRCAVTMGVGDIMRAKRLLLIINGKKEDAASQLLLGDRITPRCPVTLMKIHHDATVIIDRALADKIGYKG